MLRVSGVPSYWVQVAAADVLVVLVLVLLPALIMTGSLLRTLLLGSLPRICLPRRMFMCPLGPLPLSICVLFRNA